MSISINWKDLTPALFLEQYWQKQPLLIKGAFKHFDDPIDANELAGLAMEEFIESRIVSNKNQHWDVAHGPFEDYSKYGSKEWTLLVQAVNNWFAGVDELIKPFHFIPNWRIDDVMVSFSTPGGGVGPHLDQYDVFIVQGEGKRHWKVGLPDSSLQQVLPHEDLKQVSPFAPLIDEITEPGDLLYIPPNHPHEGVAIENSLNYSIGFQAPNPQELLSALADFAVDKDLFTNRFDDRQRQVTEQNGILAEHDIDALINTIQESLSDRKLMADFLGKHLTSVHHSMNLMVPVTPMTSEFIEDVLKAGESLYPVLGIKATYINSPKNKMLFINGEGFTVVEETENLALAFSNKHTLTYDMLKSSFLCLKNKQLLTSVINMGFWCFEQ